jgi:hypothetical protein
MRESARDPTGIRPEHAGQRRWRGDDLSAEEIRKALAAWACVTQGTSVESAGCDEDVWLAKFSWVQPIGCRMFFAKLLRTVSALLVCVTACAFAADVTLVEDEWSYLRLEVSE